MNGELYNRALDMVGRLLCELGGMEGFDWPVEPSDKLRALVYEHAALKATMKAATPEVQRELRDIYRAERIKLNSSPPDMPDPGSARVVADKDIRQAAEALLEDARRDDVIEDIARAERRRILAT